MQRVLNRPWGTLSDWINFDSEGVLCGCLVGSIAIEAAPPDLSVAAVRDDLIGKAAKRLGIRPDEMHELGVAVYIELAHKIAGLDWRHVFDPFNMSDPSDEDEVRTIGLLKARIARRLDERTVPAHELVGVT